LLHHRTVAFDFDAVAVPFRMQPGLRRMAPGATHLTPVAPGDRVLREKLAVLGAWPAEAAVASPGFDAAPALRTLAICAAHEHPDAFRVGADGTWHAVRLGVAVRDADISGEAGEIATVLHRLPAPWRAPALLALAFHEDLAVIEAAHGRIPWILACLPSGWAPEEKVGRPFSEVHAPVADNALLVAAAERLARLVTGDEAWERFVWTIHDDPRLHRHPSRVPAPAWDPTLDAEALLDSAWLRTERQTFLPVSGEAQAVFTIGVEVRPLRGALGARPDTLRIRDALASMSAAVLAYRGLTPARERLVAGLTAHAQRLPP
jgi:hypothetical protein